jgi:hypothetical protein
VATLAELTTAAEADSDREGDTSVTANWPVWCRQGIESLWRILIANNKTLFYDVWNFSLTGGSTAASASILTTAYSGTFRRIIGLDVWPDTARRRRVPMRPFVNRNDGAYAALWLYVPYCDDRGYMLQGTTLTVTPFERAAGDYRAHIRTGPVLPAGVGDSISPEMDPYAEYISDFMARKALGKEESSTDFASERMQEIRAEIIEEGDRNEGEAAAIADVEDQGEGGRWL